MATLPPLRTVRDAAPATTTPPPVRPGEPPRPFLAPAAVAPLPGMPPAAGQLLNELRALGLVETEAIQPATAELGKRLGELVTREKAADAFVHVRLITGYQKDRVLAGQTHGLTIHNYRVLDRLNGGTVGVVFLAEHAHLGRKAALKTLPADADDRPDVLARFRTEMRLLARVAHPHVVTVYDAGTVPGAPPLHYVALELVGGGDLENYVYKHGTLAPGMACEWGRQAAEGLAAAHAHNLVHRDVKPSNLLLTDGRQVKVTDFGLARHFASTMTPRSGLLGSVEFMAPEQLADATTAGPAADVYGLGATLFWLLTGKLPYPPAANLKEAIEAIRTGSPLRPKEVAPDLPDAVDKLVARMMNRFPASRPTMVQAAAELAALADPASVLPADAPPADDTHRLRQAVSFLTELVGAKHATARDAAAAVLTALGETARLRGDKPGETRRAQEYVRALANKLCRSAGWTAFSDPAHLDEVLRVVACRNVGLAAVPDAVLAGDPDDAARRAEFEKHPVYGCEILDALARKHGEALGFLRLARGVIRSHHERWDGTGFPDRLRRDAIPHAARLVALAEAYDLLRRPLGPGDAGLTHAEAVEALVGDCKGMFDPAVLDAFVAAAGPFEQVFATVPD